MIKLQKARFTWGENKGKFIPETYTACDGKYYIEKGTIGWNLYEVDQRGYTEYITTYETLRDLRNDPSLAA